MITFIPTTDEHIQYVADNMRQADRVEVMSANGMTPLESLESAREMSEMISTVVADGQVIAIMGIAIHDDFLERIGIPWLLGTDGIPHHRKEFLSLSKNVLNSFQQYSPKLVNWVHADNKISVRWLRWLGFKMEDAAPYGQNGDLFHRFSLGF